MYKIKFYEKENGKEPVKDFLDTLSIDMQTKAAWEIDLLEENGKNLTMPYCKYLKNGIWELRIKFASDISRIFYFFFDGDNIILTNGFVKKTQKIPQEELKKAIDYKKDYEERHKK
jgi:phage-related protein